jgi:hypothetical protein
VASGINLALISLHGLRVKAEIPVAVALEQLRESIKMDIIQQIRTGLLSHSSMAVVAVVGILALILAIKVAHFVTRLLLGLIAITAIGGAVWWVFLRH